MYDVTVIGGGVCGAAVAYFLSGYKLDVCVLEKENDVAMGTTKANSGIIHAGYDPKPGTLMAKLNVRGSVLTEQICKEYGVPYKKTGSLVLAFDEKDDAHIKELYERGLRNGVKGLSVLSKEEVKKIEPNLNDSVVSALYAKTAAVVNPWRLCLAMSEAAAQNGTDFLFDFEVDKIEKTENGFEVSSKGRKVETKYVVNAAGLYSDKIAKLIGAGDFEIKPSKGQYYLLDKTQSGLVNTVVFQCPTEKGKGVLVAPTADGNIIVGPDAENNNGRDDVSTTREGLDYVAAEAAKSVANINYRDNIRSFAGLRAASTEEDFIIGESNVKGFINVAGIKSPGLSSAAAIGEYVVSILEKCGLKLTKRKNYIKPEAKKRFSEMTPEERAEACRKNPKYGNVICRCNTITEAEILDALNMKLKPHTLDGVKRRAGTGMGRCQGGFCGPKVHSIICDYFKCSPEEICLDRDGSFIVKGKVGEV